ncbi:MAG: zinc ribbon domain-containing protein [Deltaproteobacteria bacterium]|nr:zinc ribbon domain-containing protein [Deltaproteobacteria bacterium]
MHISIVQVATLSWRLADRAIRRREQVKERPARAAREIGLLLLRGRTELGHAAWSTLGSLSPDAAASQMEAIGELEAAREAPLVAAAEGISVLTSVVLAADEFLPPLGLDVAGGLEAGLRAMSELPDAIVVGFSLVRTPGDPAQGIHPSEVGRVYPHLRAIDASALSGQVRCRYCGALFPFSSTRCPSCGGDVQR